MDRLAALLPTVSYLCQGLIAPQFASADLGLAEKLAVRAVAADSGLYAGDAGCNGRHIHPGPRRCRRPAISIRSVTSARAVRTQRSA
jgi:hypothetical protein